MVAPLSARLREDTREAHTSAERSGIMRELLRGVISRAQYVDLLANLAVIYDALEDELAKHVALPSLAFIDGAALRRSPALAADLRALNDAADDVQARIRPAATRYATHLRALADTRPTLLGAHAYLRYFGDLSGGQILERVITKALGLDGGVGTNFYQFPAIHDIAEFKKVFRESMDGLPLTDTELDEFVAETKRGYAFHEALFTELAEPVAI